MMGAMRQSELFAKTKREAPKDEESINAQLLIRAGFVDKVMAGVYSFLPLGLRVIKKIEAILREEMEAAGGKEVLLPTLHPKKNWQETGRWDIYDSLFKFTSHYSKNDYALGPTHEEIVSPLLKKFISSYKDLPVYVFQIQNKFRDEKRAKSGLLRGREFLMKDLYSFHADEEDLEKYYEVMKAAYRRIFERVGLGPHTILTFASGGTFSKYSHEFQTVTPAGEDVIYVCEKCRVAVNREIISEQNACPECGGVALREEKAIEVGNIFKLKTKYSDPFHLTYKDREGKECMVHMGCYGIGVNRLMGAIAEVFHDERGLRWPEAVAPYRIHMIALGSGAASHAEAWYNDLQTQGIEVLYDDRADVTAGEKFADADLLGIPWRAVVSDRTGDKVELKRRDEEAMVLATENEALRRVARKE